MAIKLQKTAHPMSPAEAAAITEEPDWVAAVQGPRRQPSMLSRISCIEWRKWHFTPLDDGRKKMAPSVDGVIALAHPRHYAAQDARRPPARPLRGADDDHCWFVSEGRAWRILGIEDKMLLPQFSFGDERQIDLTRAKWENYCAAWSAVLEAMRK